MRFFSIIIHLIKQRTHFTTWTSEGDKVYFCDLRFTSRWIKASWEKNMAEKNLCKKKTIAERRSDSPAHLKHVLNDKPLTCPTTDLISVGVNTYVAV